MLTKIGYDISVDKCLEDIPLKDFVFFERVCCCLYTFFLSLLFF